MQATFTNATTLALNGLTGSAQSYGAGSKTRIYPIQNFTNGAADGQYVDSNGAPYYCHYVLWSPHTIQSCPSGIGAQPASCYLYMTRQSKCFSLRLLAPAQTAQHYEICH